MLERIVPKYAKIKKTVKVEQMAEGEPEDKEE